ncbi:reverse transcriptase domain-containing protein [Tanacetum coccineum]
MFKQLYINFSLADALVLIPKYQKLLKSLLSNKEKLLELANTPLNENCSAVILKKLPQKQGDPGKFLIPCGFSELKCKALADLDARINLMPLSVWKKLGIARDVFVLVGKGTFPADFVIVDYESDPRVPLILGRPFLRTARALIDVHGEEMILRDGDERLILNLRHDTSSYSNQPYKESINMIDIYNVSHEEILEDLFATNHLSGNPTSSFTSHTNLTSPEVINPPSGNPTLILEPVTKSSSSPTITSFEESELIWEEFEAYLASDSFPPGNDDLPFDIESDDYDDDLFDLETVNDNTYYDPFDSISSDFLPFPECDSVFYEDFSEVDALPSTNNEDKVFNPGILIHENHFDVTNCATSNKNVNEISFASLILEDFNPPLYELPFHKEVPGLRALLSFSSKNEEKVFNPEIPTSKGVHTSLLPELSHRGSKAFKVIKIFESPMEIFPCSYGEDIRVLDVSCLHFYPP